MAVRQIQYSPVAEPPAFTPPTVPQLGWRPSSPDSAQPFTNPREYRARGAGGYRALYDTQSHAVFVPEKWAIPGTTIGKFYPPETPQLYVNRRQWGKTGSGGSRGGGYVSLLSPSAFPVFAIEQWSIPKGAGTEFPDRPQATINRRDLLARGGGYRAALSPAFMPTDLKLFTPSTVTFAQVETPDNPVRSRAMMLPASIVWDMSQPSTDVPWVPVELPDDGRLGRRLQLTAASILNGVSDGWSGPAAMPQWVVIYPDTAARAKTLQPTLLFRGEAPEQFDRVLMASATYADATRRLSLATAEHPHWVTGTSPEEWDSPSLSWRPALIDRVPLLRSQTRIESANLVLQDLSVIVPAHAWKGWVPEATRRLVLASGAMPSTFQGEALEQFAPTLLWSARYSDRAVRAARIPDYPAVSQTLIQIAAAAVTTGWTPMLVDATRRAARLPEYPALRLCLALEQLAVPSLSWQPRLVERAVRAKTLPEYPAFTIPIGLERWAVPPLSWKPVFMDRAVRANGLIVYPALSLYPGLVDVVPAPPLSWQPSKSDRPVRAPRLPEYPAFMFGLGLERWAVPALSWKPAGAERLVRPVRLPDYPAISQTAITFTSPSPTVTAPDRHPIPDRRIMTWPSVMQGFTENGAPLILNVWGWQGSKLDQMWARRLPVAEYPWLYGRGENPIEGDRVRGTVAIAQTRLWEALVYRGTLVDAPTWAVRAHLPTPLVFHTMLDFDGRFWVIGGQSVFVGSRKVFVSTDAFAWAEVGTDALPAALNDHASAVFNERMWVIGGFVPGVPPDAGVKSAVYSSIDGATWAHVGDLPMAIGGASCLVFGNELWLIGGYDENSVGLRKVFHSADGVTWTEAGSDALPIALYDLGAAVLNGAIWVLGGFSDTLGDASRRVYRSTDGTTWAEVGTEALPVALDGPSVVVFDQQLWLIGGWVYSATGPSADVYRSSDGLTWTPDASLPSPSAYGEVVVRGDTLVGTGGYYSADTNQPNHGQLDTAYVLVAPADRTVVATTVTITQRLTDTEEL